MKLGKAVYNIMNFIIIKNTRKQIGSFFTSQTNLNVLKFTNYTNFTL